MIYYEIRKVFCNFRACLLFVAIVFLNLFLGVYFQYRDYETIINGRTQLEATKEALLSGTETRDGLKKKQEDLFAEIQNTLHENKTVDKAFYRELNLLGYYLDQYDAFDQYVSFTENLKTRAEQMKLSPLWGDANSFSYRNIQKTAADYEKLDEQLQVGINEGVMFLGNAFWTDWLLLLFAIYIGFMLFKWEHENNALNLVSSCVRGRGMLGIAKVVTALSLEIGAFMFLYGSNYAIAARLYGFGGLDRAIQSVPKFQSCGISLTVGTYIVLLGVVKELALMAVSLGIWVGILAVGGTIGPVCGIIAILLGEYLLYTLITSLSKWRLLRYLNFFYFLDGCEILTVYQNLNCFGYPVSFVRIWSGVWFAMMIVLIPVLGALFVHNEKMRAGKHTAECFWQVIQKVKYKKMPVCVLHSPWYWEQKIYFYKLAGILLLISGMLCMTVVSNHESDSYYISKEEQEAEEFVKEYKGALTEDKKRKIEETYVYYNSLDEQLQESEKAYADHKITDEQIQGKRWIIKQSQQKEAAFSMFYEQYKNLDEDAWIVSQSAFDNLMMKNEAGMIVNIVLMVIIVLSASSCMTRNFKNKSVFLIRSTERGAAATFVGQSVCVLITSFVLCVFQMYLKCRNIENAFLFEGWNAPVYSISKLKDFPFSLNIQQYLILITLLQTICVCACGMLLLSLSVWIRQFQRTFLVGMLIFISPLILKMVGRMPEQSLFADHIFDMERILDKGGDLTFFAIYACAVLLMSLLCLFLAWKRFQVDR